MTRPRVSLGLEASRPTLNGPLCAELGRQLAAAREAKGLTVAQAAAHLLLTPRQVQALEAVVADAFYGADFYAIALRKYTVLLGLDPGLASQALVPPRSSSMPEPARQVPLESAPRSSKRPVSTVTGLAMAAAVVVTTGVAAVSMWPRTQTAAPAAGLDLTRATAPIRTAPVEAPSPEPLSQTRMPESSVTETGQAAARAEPAQMAAIDVRAPATQLASLPIGAEGVGLVKVAKRTWIFVRYGDNTTVERGLAPGEAFVLQGMPTYLAVGSAEDTAVVIGGHAIDTSLYTTNGQLRFGSAQLAQLPTRQ